MADPTYRVKFSPHEDYRYVWADCWDESRPPLLVAGLIPSIANATDTDPTVRKCVAIAKAHTTVGPRQRAGYGSLVVVNMFSKYPMRVHKQALLVAPFVDLIGPDNDSSIRAEAAKVREAEGTIVVAWGNDGWSRHGQMLSLLRDGGDDLWCFGTPARTDGRTAAGFPSHAALRGCKPSAVRLRCYS